MSDLKRNICNVKTGCHNGSPKLIDLYQRIIAIKKGIICVSIVTELQIAQIPISFVMIAEKYLDIRFILNHKK